MLSKIINNRCLCCGRKVYKNNLICRHCNIVSYQRKYYIRTGKQRPRYTECRYCGSMINVTPFTGLCKKCFRKHLVNLSKYY